MDERQFRELRGRYGRMSDEELKELLVAGKDEFEPEAFTILVEEAEKRRIALTEVIASAEKGAEPAESVRKDVDVENYTEVAAINDPQDKEAIQKILDGRKTGYFFSPISFSGQQLPVMVAVELAQAQEIISVLKEQTLKNTIVFS